MLNLQSIKLKSVLVMLLTFITFMFATSMMAFAQEAAEVVEQLPIGDAISQIWGLYLEHKGSSMGIIFAVVQSLMLLTKTDLLKDVIKGKTKLIAVGVLTFAGAVVSNLIDGGSWTSIIGDTAVLTALQTLVHQFIKQKKEA